MRDINTSKYKVDKPYPKVKLSEKDRYAAKLIYDDYASSVSEYTAVSQYVYAHALAKDEKTAEVFLGTAIVEMNHLDMLADVLVDLGYNPKFISGKCKIWCSNLVPYGTSTQNRIELAIKSEYEAINQYKEHIEKIHNEDLKKLLYRIIMDEELHIQIFKKLLKK